MLVTAIHNQTHSLTKPHRAQEQQRELLTAVQLEIIITSKKNFALIRPSRQTPLKGPPVYRKVIMF